MENKEQKWGNGKMAVLAHKDRVSLKQKQELLSKLNQLEQEYLWISANEKKLRERYLNKYIAVKDEQVVFSSDDFEALLKVLLSSEVDVDSFAIKRVTDKTPCLIL